MGSIIMHAGVRMEHVQISKYPLEEQLKLLSQATVVVSNIGSRSFRLIYLPNGATTILVGPPECAPSSASSHALPDPAKPNLLCRCACTLFGVTRRKHHRPGIAPNANTTHVPTAGSTLFGVMVRMGTCMLADNHSRQDHDLNPLCGSCRLQCIPPCLSEAWSQHLTAWGERIRHEQPS